MGPLNNAMCFMTSVMSGELEKMWMEMFVNSLHLLSQHLNGGTEENRSKS
jgi:hypothetical protein